MGNRKILLIDDDSYFVESTRDTLLDAGFQVLTAATLSQAKVLMLANDDAEAVILDIMMPPDGESPLQTQMGYRSGIVLARWIRENYPAVKIIGISGVKSLDVSEWFDAQRIPLFEKGSGEFILGLKKLLMNQDTSIQVKTFIVHGQDDRTKYELKNFLQNRLKLPEPTILHEQPSVGRTIIEKFEEIAHDIDLVFVLLTPDDSALNPASNEMKRRARQNVIFEMGYFFAKLQRRSGKVLLLYKGELELPSDIAGIIYIDITQGIDAAGESIRKELFALGLLKAP